MSNLKHRLNPDNFSNRDKKEHIRKAKDRKFYGFSFDQGGMHPLSIALDIFQSNGDRMGIYYLEIASPIQYTQGGAIEGNSITFQTTNQKITIKGKNLVTIYEYLLEQRLVWIKEQDSSLVEVSENEPIIKEIEIDKI